VPVSLLPGLARALGVMVETLIDDAPASPPAQARTRRGPPSRLEQQLDAVIRLPKAQQKFVLQMLDTVLAQQAG
jgi:hypothetical protein